MQCKYIKNTEKSKCVRLIDCLIFMRFIKHLREKQRHQRLPFLCCFPCCSMTIIEAQVKPCFKAQGNVKVTQPGYQPFFAGRKIPKSCQSALSILALQPIPTKPILHRVRRREFELRHLKAPRLPLIPNPPFRPLVILKPRQRRTRQWQGWTRTRLCNLLHLLPHRKMHHLVRYRADRVDRRYWVLSWSSSL